MAQKGILFVAAFIVWCLFNWPPDTAHVVVGLCVAFLVAVLLADLVIQQPQLMWHPRRYIAFIFHYVPVFLWEVLKANIDVARRVSQPDLPIHPGIVKVKTSLHSDIGLTFLANSITLTPGTLSVDISKDKSVLYVHWIDVRTHDIEAATRIIVERFEKILRKIFEEGEESAKG